MSRSFKKHPYCTDGRAGRKPWKRRANKIVRNYKNNLADGKNYKKLYNSWNIHDYISRWSWPEVKKEWENGLRNTYLREHYPTLKELYKFWKKYYHNK